MTKRKHQPFGQGANGSGRALVKKMESERNSEKEFAKAVKQKLAQRGVSSDWMKKHLIITKI